MSLYCCWVRLSYTEVLICVLCFFFLQAEDGIRDLVRSRGLGDVYKRQALVLLVGQYRVEVGERFDPGTLARLVSTLERI